MTRQRTRPNGRVFNLLGEMPARRPRSQVDGTTTVYLYDEISYWGVTAGDFVATLQGIDTETIDLHINSPGGDVFEAIAILNSLRQHPATVNVTVDGLAASAASFVAMAGDTVTMARNAEMMIHDAWGLVLGNAADMREMADRLDSVSNNIASIYAGKAGGTVEDWRAVMLGEKWYSAEEAVSAGLADSVDGAAPAVENAWDLSMFNRSTNKSPGAGASTAPPAPAPVTSAPAEDDFEWDINEIRRAFEEAAA